MPLRDHFRAPISLHSSWEGFHGGWPMTMVMQLDNELPQDFSAEPRVKLGPYFEDVDASLDVPYEYEVLIYDQRRSRLLVAAVEIVSPANKDRPQNRRAFVAKCAALMQKSVCVSIVDLITTRQFNLYTDLLDLMGQADPSFIPPPRIAPSRSILRRVTRRRVELYELPEASLGIRLPQVSVLPNWGYLFLSIPPACRGSRARSHTTGLPTEAEWRADAKATQPRSRRTAAPGSNG